jgi:hypothetical protein
MMGPFAGEEVLEVFVHKMGYVVGEGLRIVAIVGILAEAQALYSA